MILLAAVPALATPSVGPHHAEVLQHGAVHLPAAPPPRGVLPIPSPGPDLTVYGYLAYWEADLATVQWDELTHLAIFNAEASSTGTLSNTSRWDIADEALALAAPYGVRVHLCVTNFDTDSLRILLGSSTYRQALIDELASWVATTGVHGINIDFEGVPGDRRAEMVTFTRDLEAAVGEVVLATPAVDWSDAWDYAQLTQHADLFIMGYGYHWGGSSYAGPTDPLYAGSGTVWSGIQSYSLSRSVDDYLAKGADPSRVILGLPLYGMRWPTSGNAVPSPTLGSGSSIFFDSAWAEAAVHGRNHEPDSDSTFTHDGSEQIWYGDTDTVRSRIAYVRDATSIGGVGFWALHYTDDPTFWQMVHDETTWTLPTDSTTSGGPTDTGEPPDPGGPTGTGGAPDFRADAGRPLLAYVGDTVVLSGEGSQGPEGISLDYRWTQLEGPAVQLADVDIANPVFRIEQPGNLVFELLVGDGTAWSAPSRSYVVVVDPDVARRHERGCGCATGAPIGWLSVPFLLTVIRRRL